MAILLLYLAAPIPIQTVRHAAFDQYQRWHSRPYADVQVRIVDIDEQSLARHGQWPGPRERLAELVRRLDRAGAAAIAFDVVFAEADRVSSRALAGQWALEGPAAAAVSALTDPDERFAAALQEARVVLGFTLEHAGEPQRPLALGYRIVTRGESALAGRRPIRPRRFRSPPFAAQPRASAPSASSRMPTGSCAGSSYAPTPVKPWCRRLLAETLGTALGERNYVASALDGAEGLATLRIGRYQVPTTEQGEAWIPYSLPQPQRYLPAWSVLDGSASTASLRGGSASRAPDHAGRRLYRLRVRLQSGDPGGDEVERPRTMLAPSLRSPRTGRRGTPSEAPGRS